MLFFPLMPSYYRQGLRLCYITLKEGYDYISTLPIVNECKTITFPLVRTKGGAGEKDGCLRVVNYTIRKT
jgi:hypothetical protein